MCPEWTSESWCKEDSNVNLKPLIIQMRGTDARRVLARCTPLLARQVGRVTPEISAQIEMRRSCSAGS